MIARMWLPAAVIVAAGWAQTESAITREGGYWVQTVTGVIPLGGSSRVRVSTRGEVSITGESRTDIAYWLKKRVRTRIEERARAELARWALLTSRQGEWTVLRVEPRGDGHAELRLAVPRSLRETAVDSDGGSVRAQDLHGNLKADTGGGQIDIDRVQGDVQVRSGGGNIRLGRIKGAVRCSAEGGSITAESLGKNSELNTGGGEIRVREAAGPVRVFTGGGNIEVGRAVSLIATTGGGVIDVEQVEGPVRAETGAGAVKVRSARGVQAFSGAGAIQLHAVSGGLRASTGVGSIIAELAAGQPLEDSSLVTASGDITVYIPVNLAVTVQAVTTGAASARIISEFPEIQARLEQSRAEARGALNGGGPVLRLAATGGAIYLKKK